MAARSLECTIQIRHTSQADSPPSPADIRLGRHPPEQTPPSRYPPPGQTPPGQTPPGQTPPPTDTPRQIPRDIHPFGRHSPTPWTQAGGSGMHSCVQIILHILGEPHNKIQPHIAKLRMVGSLDFIVHWISEKIIFDSVDKAKLLSCDSDKRHLNGN